MSARTEGHTSSQAAGRRPTRWRRAIDAVDERMGLKALAYDVPEHANNLAWSLGALTAISFFLLLVSGIYIAQWYNPMPEVANQSVRTIMTQAPLGAFARGLHYWAAQAMYILALVHMLRVFFTGSFKRPREGNWIVGAAMLLLTELERGQRDIVVGIDGSGRDQVLQLALRPAAARLLIGLAGPHRGHDQSVRRLVTAAGPARLLLPDDLSADIDTADQLEHFRNLHRT